MSDLDKSQPFTSQSGPNEWERELLSKMVMSTVAENRRSRRWNIFFKFLIFAYLFGLLAVMLWADKFNMESATVSEHTALIEIKGLIADGTKASADHVVTGLRNAFKDKKTKAVILRINTPGGSPVQSRYINDEIVRLMIEF